jgi:hypothetical protein
MGKDSRCKVQGAGQIIYNSVFEILYLEYDVRYSIFETASPPGPRTYSLAKELFADLCALAP